MKVDKELKTLKDFGKIYAQFDRDNNDYSDPNVSVKELKAEAVKWVKSRYYHELGIIWGEDITRWIKHFFNLTEEDLK